MDISTSMGLFGQEPMQAVRFLHEAGFNTLDVNLYNILWRLGPLWRQTIDDAAKEAKRRGVYLRYSHLPFQYPEKDDVQGWKTFHEDMMAAIQVSAELGVEAAVVHPCTTAQENFDLAVAKQAAIEHLSPFVCRAKALGLTLAVENMRGPKQGEPTHRYCSTAQEVCDLADTLSIGVCWDFGHAHLSGLDQKEALAYVAGRLKAIHIDDNFGIGDDHVAPFQGKIDWAYAMAGLKASGYAGALNYEINAARIPNRARKKYAAYLLETAQELLALMA